MGSPGPLGEGLAKFASKPSPFTQGWGRPAGPVVKESACQCRGHGSNLLSGKIPHARLQGS